MPSFQFGTPNITPSASIVVPPLLLIRVGDDGGNFQTVTFLVDGDKGQVRRGDMLRLTMSDLRDDGIATTFQGDVRDLRTGAGEHPRSLMPTLLDWLRQRQGLSLLWGTALYMFGVVTTFRKWWRKPE